jgi:hypothetical protein
MADEIPQWRPRAFRVLRADRAADQSLAVGDTVYSCKGWDYGCANDDTRMTGIEHTSVTFRPDGDYPFFTIPRADLELAKAEPQS